MRERNLVLAALLAAAFPVRAQPAAPAYAPGDFAKAIREAPCRDGQPRDAGGACPVADEGESRGFRLLRDNASGASRPDASSAVRVPAKIAARPAASPLSDLRISFRLGSAELLPAGAAQARALAVALTEPQFSSTRFEIAGYTDATGSPERNLALSDARAEAVRAFLVANGVEAARLSAKGYGSQDLLYPDRPRDASNRRVEARLLN
jgi:outer membrane protein OmpA-like peptidoglycan-associated protein